MNGPSFSRGSCGHQGAGIVAPDRTISPSRNGSTTINKTDCNAIGGITGRVNIPNSRFSLSFSFDACGGALPLTWQAYGGVAYSVKDWIDVSAGDRHPREIAASASRIDP
jgi:hypothetical protein